MASDARPSFRAQLKALREAAGFTQEELATISGLSVHAVSALERGERRRPHPDTVRALSAALDLNGPTRDALLASARAAESAAIEEPSGGSLPMPLTALLGRETDMRALRRLLADSAARLITIVGPGGVGKTRLALELANGIAGDGSIRVVFVPLAAVRDTAFVASAVGEACGLVNVTHVDLPRRARAACRDRPTLLVLDNFEQILEAAQLVADLLMATTMLRLLVTSRSPLRVRGEREYALGPLAMDVDGDGTAPAVRLFVERVRSVQPDFEVTAANSQTVTAICRRLDALPLALELAAPWLKVLSAADLLRRLEQDALLPAAGPRDLPERQRTMNATIGRSYQLLGRGEQRAFRRFGAMPGRFSFDAAAAVLAGRDGSAASSVDTLGALAELIDKSLLLEPETDVATRPLYQMLETVRAYAARELGASLERDDAVEGLVRYCVAEAGLASEGLVAPTQREWMERVQADLDNYRQVLAWLLERGRSAEAADIAAALMPFWWIRGHTAEGLRWYEKALDLRSLPAGAESRALLGAAAMWYAQGRLERARPLLARARTLAHAAGDVPTGVRSADMSARVEWGLGDLPAARHWFGRAFDGYQSLGVAWGAGNALIGISGVALEIDDDEEAERLLTEATLLLRDAGPWFRARALFVRAIIAVRRGDADAAAALARESLGHLMAMQDTYTLVHALVPLAAATARQGRDWSAARVLGARDAVAERTGSTVVVKPVHSLEARTAREVRARLGADRWARAYAEGRSLSLAALLSDLDQSER